MKKNNVYTGKKKTAIARVTIKKGNGNLFINNKSIEIYNPKVYRLWILEPIILAEEILGDKIKKIDIFVNVKGGGISGQAQAIRTAIGKALIDHFESEDLRNLYSEYDRSIFIDDSRRKEPKKDTRRGARARYQTSYR